MMAKDFWQQVSVGHHFEAETYSSEILVTPRESTPVLATCWQRTAGVHGDSRDPFDDWSLT